MKFRAALFAASLLAFAGTALVAQNPDTTMPNNESSLSTAGTVVSSGATSVVVRLDDGTERTFSIDNRSSVPAGLSAGTRVTVRYSSEAGGYRALTVTTGAAMPTTSTTDRNDTSTATTNNDANTNSNLPATASALPLIAVAGLLFLTAALLMGSAQRRQA